MVYCYCSSECVHAAFLIPSCTTGLNYVCCVCVHIYAVCVHTPTHEYAHLQYAYRHTHSHVHSYVHTYILEYHTYLYCTCRHTHCMYRHSTASTDIVLYVHAYIHTYMYCIMYTGRINGFCIHEPSCAYDLLLT